MMIIKNDFNLEVKMKSIEMIASSLYAGLWMRR